MRAFWIVSLFCICAAICQEKVTPLKEADKLYKDGNYAEAYVIYKKILADKASDTDSVTSAFSSAKACQSSLGKTDEKKAHPVRVRMRSSAVGRALH